MYKRNIKKQFKIENKKYFSSRGRGFNKVKYMIAQCRFETGVSEEKDPLM